VDHLYQQRFSGFRPITTTAPQRRWWDGQIVAAAQQERFFRKKYDARFPCEAIAYCLSEAGLEMADFTHIVFYDKPLLEFERLLETYLAFAPRGFSSFVRAIPVWLSEGNRLRAQ